MPDPDPATDRPGAARAHPRTRPSRCLRRPFAPGAIGFRAMTKVALNGDPYGGAQVAAYLGAQSVLQRLNCVVPGRWRMSSPRSTATCSPRPPTASRARLYLACRLHRHAARATPAAPTSTPSTRTSARCDAGSLAGLKALYSDARKRAAVAAGIGAYLYTALAAVVLPIGPGARQVQCDPPLGQERPARALRRHRAWLRDGYRARMNTDAVLRDLGAILAHGEPDDGIGQGESTDAAARSRREPRRRRPPPPPPSRRRRRTGSRQRQRRAGHDRLRRPRPDHRRPRHEPGPRAAGRARRGRRLRTATRCC